MSAVREKLSSTAISVGLDGPADLVGWRRAVRRLAAADIEPANVLWSDGSSVGDLFGSMAAAVDDLPAPSRQYRVPKRFGDLVDRALLNADPARFTVAYRVFRRAIERPQIVEDAADGDISALYRWAKEVNRDAHKMKAFVRFRKVGERDERECFAAWFEPFHHTLEATAPFFARRFANMDWSIITPRATAHHVAGELFFGPGGTRDDVPASDAAEEDWRAYYRNIFNPARIKLGAMRAEMPKKYWRNMPETDQIPAMLAAAPARLAEMAAQSAELPSLAEVPPAGRADVPNSLGEMNAQLAECTRCGICSLNSGPVAAKGPAQAGIMLVGEQPGDEEDRKRAPFVGPAGRVLDDVLCAALIDRNELYVTNAVKGFKFTPRGKRRLHQRPNAGEIDHCRWWLDIERQLVRPRVIVALGATALRGVTGKANTISRVRGRPIRLGDGATLVTTIHPSYLLRLTDEGQARIERDQFIRDLESAALEAVR